MFENKNFQSWFKENTPKEGLSETTTFSKQFVKDAWDNGYYVGYNKAKKVQVVEHFEAYGQCRDSRRIASLEKENAELKEKLEIEQNARGDWFGKAVTNDRRLTEAKELLTKWVELFKPKGSNIPPTPIQVDTEQFLKEEVK